MNNNVADSIIEQLVARQVIKQNDEVIYRYGLEVFFTSIIELTSLLLIAFMVGNFVETLIFFLAFIPLRLFGGGFHATTKTRCYIISVLMYGFFTISMKITPIYVQAFLSLFIMLISVVIICAWAPVMHNGFKLDVCEENYYKKLSRIIIFLEAGIVIAGYVGEWFEWSFVISLGVFAEVLSIIVTKAFQRIPRIDRKQIVATKSGIMKKVVQNGMRTFSSCILACAKISANTACIIPYYETEKPKELEQLKVRKRK